jgi:hypothetical protein
LTGACSAPSDDAAGAGDSPESAGTETLSLTARPSARLVLSDAVLTRLRARAASGDAAWTELKQRCDGYATGTAYPPNGNAYPNYPNVGQGYQGEEYLPVIRALGLCYRASSDAAAQARYADAGSRVLVAMSTPVAAGGQKPSTDAGYGIRNYVVGMAIGYDWLYPALSASTKSAVVSSINAWIDWYDASGFSNGHSIGNYFAGYFLAKTMAALATEGDNPKAAAYWDDVVTRMWGKLVKPQFTSMMSGGGWPEGWGYGKKAVLSMAEALRATKTATGLDWWSEVPLAHDQAQNAMHFAWPSLKHVDDDGTIRSGTSTRPSAELFTGLASMLEAAGDTSATAVRSFAADVVSIAGDDRAPWAKFLYGDPAAAATSYATAGLSHWASGPSHVAMRSGWDTKAVWAGFSGGAYINAPDSGEQLFDSGGLRVVVGDQPLLINATGWLPQNAGTAGEDMVYDDGYGTRQRRLYNTFFVDDASNPYNPGQNSKSPESSRAHVERYEDRAGFVHARGVGLGDQYGSSTAHPVAQFTRDVVYVRPGTFVLFDRTTVAKADADQWLSFHTPVAAVRGTTADSTQRRFDVSPAGVTVGSINSLLPRSAAVVTTSLPAGASRLELHAPVRSASQQWLTVVSAGAAAPQVRLSSEDGNVASGNLVGVETQGQVVLFAADQAGTGSVTSADYTVAQAAAKHVLVDVEPSSAGYSVTATPESGKLRIRVSPGGVVKASASKTLSFDVAADGGVTGNDPGTSTSAPAPTPTPEPTLTPEPTPTPEPEPTPSSGTSKTSSFTQGVDGYSGVSDASISNLYYSSTSTPAGTTFKTNDMLYTYTLDYTTKALLKFDLTQVPTGAKVVAAKLGLTFESWTSPQALVGQFLGTPWSIASASLGWTNGGAGAAWKTLGIGATDVVGTSFLFSSIDASGYQRKTVALDPASVQRWVSFPLENQGLVLASRDLGKVLRIYSSEATDPGKRPTLEVTFQ